MTDIEDVAVSLPAGSTIILSTISPDKRAEYENIFKRFDINFIFLDELGLSPQKTDEMTNTYDGNLIQKACEVSLALHLNDVEIKQRLSEAGFDVDKPIVGMVEDSGIAIYPKDRAKRKAFNDKVQELIEYKIFTEFRENAELRQRTFPEMPEEEIDNYLQKLFQNNKWMIEIAAHRSLPGPNFKPIFEALQGGICELFTIFYQALREISDSASEKEAVYERRTIRFLNHCSMMLVEPHAEPTRHITAMNIVTGENKGWIKSLKEMEELIAARRNPEAAHLMAGEFFTGDMLVPDGQQDTSNLSQQDLINEGMLWTKNNKRANYYRLAAAGELLLRHDLPIATRYQYKDRVENPSPLSVLVLHSGEKPSALVTEFRERLAAGKFAVLNQPSQKILLDDPRSRLMETADLVFIMAGEGASEMQNAQLVLGATVDKQVMPSAKEKTIIILNPREKGKKAAFDGVLRMIRHAKMSGLKNGLSEIDHIIEYDPANYQNADRVERLYVKVQKALQKEQNRKRHRLTEVPPVQPKKNIAPAELVGLPSKAYTIFVAGGAANEYPEFKAAANQLGRYIYHQGWVLVTGAGQKDGPMGAVHSGFVEAYLQTTLKEKIGRSKAGLKPKDHRAVWEVVDKQITDTLIQRGMTGDVASVFSRGIMRAVFQNPDAEYLAHQAPGILLRLLEPKREGPVHQIVGSLKEAGRMVGYSMPPLLISEGSGKWPMGMQGHNAGNMQRRMERMLRSAAHVFLAGGQGTYQELVESAKLAIEAGKHSDKADKAIYVLDQPSYGEGIYDEPGTVFRPVLEAIDADLAAAGLRRKDINLQVFSSMRALETALRRHSRKFHK